MRGKDKKVAGSGLAMGIAIGTAVGVAMGVAFGAVRANADDKDQ